MDERELKLECLKLAVPLVSPTVSNRAQGVVEIATQFYNHITSEPAVKSGLTARAEKRRGTAAE